MVQHTATDRQRVEALIKRGMALWTVWRWCFITGGISRLSWPDDALFQHILYNPNNVLHSLLPDLNATRNKTLF